MRIETTSKTVYQFDELSDRAKERARDWYRQGMETSDYAESVIEDAARMADLLGINLRGRVARLLGGGTRMEPEVYWSGFSHQGQGACFVGSYHYRKGSARAIAAEAPSDWTDRETGKRIENKSNAELNRIAAELADLQRAHFYRLSANVSPRGGNDCHEMSVSIDVFDGENDADDETADAMRELLRDFMRWIYRSLESEYEYQMSDAQVDESLRANEYEFDEDGDRA